MNMQHWQEQGRKAVNRHKEAIALSTAIRNTPWGTLKDVPDPLA